MAGLEACQSDPALVSTLENLTMHLAMAQKSLFPASNLEVTSPACIDMLRKSMDNLAQALKILQDIDSDAAAIGIAAASIAKSLQILHPVVQHAKHTAELVNPVSQNGTVSRVDVNTVLSLSTDHTFYTGFSEDINEGGIFVSTFEPKPKGADVVVNFKLPGGIPISAKGVVQFTREYNTMSSDMVPGMGVKFISLLPQDKKAIEKFLTSRAAMFYDD